MKRIAIIFSPAGEAAAGFETESVIGGSADKVLNVGKIDVRVQVAGVVRDDLPIVVLVGPLQGV